MKHLSTLKSLLLVLFALLGGVNVWGETKVITLENIGSSLTSTSNTKMAQTTVTTKEDSSPYVLNYLQGKKQGSSILLAKSTGAFISNNTPVPGVITSVEVFINSGASGKTTYYCAFGAQEFTSAYSVGCTAENITGGNSHVFNCSNSGAQYFCVSLGNPNNGQVLKLVINYVEDGAVVVPAPTFTVPSGTYTTTQTVKVDNYSSDYIYAYTTDGSEPAFSSLKVSNGTEYDHEAGIQISSSCTLKMVATDIDGNTSNVASAIYTLPIVFTSLEELAAADLTSGTLVTVSFADVPIKDIYVTTAGYRNGVYFDIQKGGNDIEIYCQDVPEEWKKEDKLSGTITGTWKLYRDTWELVPEEGWKWSNLTHTAAAIKQDASIEMTSKTSLLIGETDTYEVTYTGDGTLAVVSSDPSVATATITGTTVTITALAKGQTTITISAPSTESCYAVEKSYDLYVSAPLTPAANGYESVDFTKIEPYCSLGTGNSATVEDYEGTSFNMVFAKPQSSTNPTKYYENGTSVRAYKGNTITITAAEEIQAVKVNYVSGKVDDGEKVTGLGTKEVVITSSTTCWFTSIDVYYKGVTLSATDGTDYYATFSSDKAVEFVDAEVYTVNVTGTKLVLNEVTSKQVPANEGVLIKTTGTKALYKYIDEAVSLGSNNLLPSSLPMKESGYMFYKLAYGDWKNKADLGFYWGAENGAAFTAKAGGAYLAVPTGESARVKGFAFGADEETAIESVEAETANEEIFDLSGRKVSKAVKGLYIINGKKVVK